MFMVDMEQGKIVGDQELKSKISSEQDYSGWLDQSLLDSDHLPDAPLIYPDFDSITKRQRYLDLHSKTYAF